MPAALNDSYLVIICTENDPVFLINPDAGISAEITLQHFYFAIRALITIPHDILQQFVDLFQRCLLCLQAFILFPGL